MEDKFASPGVSQSTESEAVVKSTQDMQYFTLRSENTELPWSLRDATKKRSEQEASHCMQSRSIRRRPLKASDLV